MSEFKSWLSFFKFREAVTRQRRYVLDADTREFLETIRETSHKRVIYLEEGETLWRAQLGSREKKDEILDRSLHPFGPERMKPLRDQAREGRANPKGIPYLYLATDDRTAMAEVRPWIGSRISLGQFKATRRLCLVDCSKDEAEQVWYACEPPPEEREKVVWSHVNREFSEPVSMNDDVADYVPTQIIAEFTREAGFDGIKYKSALEEGFNIVLFDLGAAQQTYGALHEAKRIHFEFGAGHYPYLI